MNKTKIELIRTKLKLNRTQFAKQLGLSQGAISHYEKRMRTPKIPVYFQIIDLAARYGLSINLDDLIERNIKDT